jgi:fructose/tagatose bisphosphate aldolase
MSYGNDTDVLKNWQRTQDEDKQNKNTTQYHYTQTNTNNVSKTRALLQTAGGKDEPNIVFMRKSNGHHNRSDKISDLW